jgi:enterochelin esterase-like enzyme
VIESNHSLSSASLGYLKKIWVFRPSAATPATRLLVFTDAEIYLERVRAREAIRPLVDATEGEPLCVVFVSHGTEAQRSAESLFSRNFSTFLCEELPAFLREQGFVTATPMASLCGLSLTGLATLMVAIHYPGTYHKMAAQSGAYWPEDGRVVRELEKLAPGASQEFYFDVGSEETDREGEVMSQQEGIEAVSRVLKAKGYSVTTYVFDGGHSTAGWRAALPRLLNWMV